MGIQKSILKNLAFIFILIFSGQGLILAQAGPGDQDREILDLSGKWGFRLDNENSGLQEEWFRQDFEESVQLPGTTDENQKGVFKDERRDDRLSRIWHWVGPAWYQKEVEIPADWKDKHISLYLERTKDVVVWFDDNPAGGGNSLSAPHIYDLTGIATPGKHTVTILVDNSKLPPVGPAHAVDERTQTNWNGIVGRIELQASCKLHIEEIRVYPDIANNQARLEVHIDNQTMYGGFADIIVQGRSLSNEDPKVFTEIISPVLLNQGKSVHKVNYVFNGDYPLWSEFNPELIEISASIKAQDGNNWLADNKKVSFGMREFTSDERGFKINGNGVFLRGSQDCAIFPITGYAPMDKEAWMRLFGIARSYGINHYRFHSWCPPEAAFQAADDLGIYLQPELPNKSDIGRPDRDEYLTKEGELIFKAFGNHPSFVMFTLGNELGRNQAYYDMVEHFRNTDPRRLYAQGSNNENYPGGDLTPAEGDDFWVTSQTVDERPVRGSYFQGDCSGHVENQPPSTMVDYDESIVGLKKPVVAHEIGQYQVSPDFSEIEKFTGVLKQRNYEIFRDRLEAANMLDQSDDFVKASGALAVICYREDIEASLRTRHLGGFQLLGLHDFTGQGTAPVGILNVFMQSKGLIKPEKWREFCSEVVPLLRMQKYTWTNKEIFAGEIEVSNFSPVDIPGASIEWTVRDEKGGIIHSGETEKEEIIQGALHKMGFFAFPLKGIASPQKLTIELSLKGTRYTNHYNIWVYPDVVDNAVPDGIMLSQKLDSGTKDYLMDGGSVLLIPGETNESNSVKGAFQTDFWCFPMFRRAAIRNNIEVAPGTLGILCDPEAPALEGFPTEYHSNWQWWHLVKNSNPIILDKLPADYRPTVQVIDNFFRNHKLGLIFEMKVGKGKLLVCSIDLMNQQDKPEGRQLLNSILKYMDSSKFSPRDQISIEALNYLSL
jgi:hypothetical protein